MLTRLIPLTSSCAVLLLGASLANASDRSNGLNVLVVPLQRGGQDVVVSVKDRVRQAVVGKLVAEGHTVFDDLMIRSVRSKTDARKAVLTAIGERTTRADAPRYDALILVAAELTHFKGIYTSSYAVRLTGSLVDPRTGRYLADPTTTIAPRRRIPATCDADCLQRLGAQQVETAATMLGAKMARNLARLPQSRRRSLVPTPSRSPRLPARSLVFRGFTPAEFSVIEEYLTAMPDIVGLRPIPGRSGRTVFRFDAFKGRNGLKQSLQTLFAHLRFATEIKNQTEGSLVIEAPAAGGQSTTASNDW